jgi:streptomycin 3"-adenylyltransferase
LDSSDKEWQAEVAAPEEITRQLDHISVSLCEIEQENLIGIYLHGSLAMGCFHPQHSDLDMLVLVEQAPAPTGRRAWAQQMLQLSGAPAPIELSLLHRSQYVPWRHPTPFSFHFSESWRAAIGRALDHGAWPDWNATLDPDLAGHFTVTRSRGVRLAGAPIASTVPEVPWADYLDSILRDYSWACERADDNPVYLVLNTCRIWAAIADQLVLSKTEGAAWALPRLPADLASIVTAAAALYSSRQAGRAAGKIAGSEALRVARWVARANKKRGPPSHKR